MKKVETKRNYSLRSSVDLGSVQLRRLAIESESKVQKCIKNSALPKRSVRLRKTTSKGESRAPTTSHNGSHNGRTDDEEGVYCNTSPIIQAYIEKPDEKYETTRKSTANNVLEKDNYPLDLKRSVCLELSKDNFVELEMWSNQIRCIECTLNNTVTEGKSGSLLVCGGPGVGKTSVLNHCLRNLQKLSAPFTTLHLSGLVQSTDKLALNYVADNLDFSFVDLPSFVSTFEARLKEGLRLVVILDMFHLFCRRHQTFLYNLFDISQRVGNLCVIGVTRRLDCVELLEKRVKSRMNQRIIHLISPFKSFDEYLNFATALLKNRLEVSSFLIEKLKNQFSVNKSILAMKKCLIENLLLVSQQEEVTSGCIMDAKTQTLCSLSLLEFCIVLLSFKFVSSKEVQTFNSFSLQPYLSEIPAQIGISHKLFLKVIDNLVQRGVLRICSSSDNGLYLTEWTTLSLAIDEFHIKQAFAINEQSLPANITRLLTTLR